MPFKAQSRRRYESNAQLTLAANRTAFEMLEGRQMLAAHIVGVSTAYGTIQAAVNAASPGAIINVDAGNYTERVTISKQLTIRGAQAGVDARSNGRLYAALATETVLNGYDTGTGRSPSFIIKANDVTLDGFIIQNNTQAGDNGAGLIIGPSQHGTHVFNNIFQNNVSGMFLSNDSSTDACIIQHNVFRSNNNNGPNGGEGIYTDGGVSGGNLTNVLIDGNAFLNNRGGSGTTTYEAAIALVSRTNNTQSNFTITNNVFDGNGKGVLAWNVNGIVIQYNVITNTLDHWSGTWRFEGDVHDALIQYNNTYNNTGTGIRVDNKGYNSGTNSTNFVVTNNNFYGNSNYYTTKESVAIGTAQYDGLFDVRYNWWGNASGPSFVQPGTGDRISPNGNTIRYSPWATTPVVSTDTPYFGLAFSESAVIQAEDFDHGGEGSAYHDMDKTNAGGKYRTSGVDIETTTDTGAGADVYSFTAGEWMDYQVNVAQAGQYKFDFRVASLLAGGVFHLEVDRVNVTGPMSVPNTGGKQIWQTLSKAGISLSAGNHVLRLVGDSNGASGSVGSFNWLKFSNIAIVPAAPSNLLAAAFTTSRINLTWRDNATNETGFKIERSLDGVTFSPLATVGANITSYSDQNLTNGQTYWYRVSATSVAGNSAVSNVALTAPVPANAPPVFLGDLPWVSATSDWGTVQIDSSIKGDTISLRGTTYAKGLGTHAVSNLVYNLNGQYTNFVSDIGIDDEVSNRGSVIFRVVGDGQILFDSGVITGSSPVVHVNVDVTGMQQLTLIATGGDEGVEYDHADWAGAQLFKSAPALAAPSAPANLQASATSPSIVNLNWFNTNNTQSGVLIERSTDGISFATLATAGPAANSFADTTAAANTTYYYRLRATNTAGDSANSNMVSATTLAAPVAVTYVSDLNWVSATTDWGTTQKDLNIKSLPITLRGTIYTKGIGTHAVSQTVYNIAGQYSAFMSDIGIDDEVNGNGAVIFQVLGDGVLLYDSGVLTGESAVGHININITGVQQLTLQVLGGVADNVYYDHADWAQARLVNV